MMKKLLVLALVLSIATVANAALVIHAPATLAVGGTTVITLEGLTGQVMLLTMLTVEGPGTLDFETLTPIYAGSLAVIDDVLNVEDGQDWFDAIVGANENVTQVVYGEFFDATGLKPEGDLYTIELTCDGLGDVILTLLDEDFETITSVTIEQIPEPATMLLLGLGGLFLRRK